MDEPSIPSPASDDETMGKPQTSVRVITWIARIWSLLSLAFVLTFFSGYGIQDGFAMSGLTARDLVMLLCWPVGILIGMTIGWFRQGLGGWITAGSLIAFYLADIAFTGTPPGGPYFLLVAFPGILFLIVHYLGKRPIGPSLAAS